MPSKLPFHEELRAFVLGDSEIQSYIEGRMGPLPLKQGTQKASLTYSEKGRDDAQIQTGPDCFTAHSWPINCWATTYDEMRLLAKAVRRKLNGYDGAMGGFSRVSFFMENQLDSFEDESKLHRGMLDFTVWYREEL